MEAFDRLHPSLQHHIVNSLGWRELRPFQEQVIPPILRGENVLVLAPTAGGKTEAAALPVLSRMLDEDWNGLSTLYLCPTKALLNNLHVRLSRYATLVGRRCEVWHGDTSAGKRAGVNRTPPDILLTTPESLEVMLVSKKTDAAVILGSVRTVIIDEVHAFAGDDRGWHLLSVLQRIAHLAGRDLQRIGLSATVGNPEELLQWLVAGNPGVSSVIRPPPSPMVRATIQLDFVGSLQNAAVVISRLHRGEKRLVFVDSRCQAEKLAAMLTDLQVKTFVTHSSLSKDQRDRVETAFAQDNDCVIVATSVLELGMDVGDLDRVIQIDAPSKVASFLQRLGRTGRRAGSERNCLFLATHDSGLLQAAALLDLWEEGFVENVVPPPVPYHVFIQQVLAMVLQQSGMIRTDWQGRIGRVPAFAQFLDGRGDAIVDHCLRTGLLCDDGGVLMLGPEAEKRLGQRHFMELLSVITSSPLIQVNYAGEEIGHVHPLSFGGDPKRPKVLSLGGRGWTVIDVDWKRRTAEVKPSTEAGLSMWLGSSVPLTSRLCGRIRKLLVSVADRPFWSNRGRQRISELRQEMAGFYPETGTALVRDDSHWTWWTFAGLVANQTLAAILEPFIHEPGTPDNLCIRWPNDVAHTVFMNAIRDAGTSEIAKDVSMVDGVEDILKFADLLPPEFMRELTLTRLADIPQAQAILVSTLSTVFISQE